MDTSLALSHIGVPKEIKPDERRVALTPDGANELTRRGARVVVESGAGRGAGFSDDDYRTSGAEIGTVSDAWSADLVVKVKEPKESEFDYLRSDLTLFTYLHLAAYPGVAQALLAAGTTAWAYETVTDADGSLPLLAPMSTIAGALAGQMGAHHLSAHLGGYGVLVGGAPGVPPAQAVVVGAGNVGWTAARNLLGLGASVTVIDRDLRRLAWIDEIASGRCTTLAASAPSIARAVAGADLVVGAVLVAGGRAPVVVDEQMVASMRPGSVIVDVAVDQGGCVATTVETTHHEPTRVVHGVVHYAVGNMPGAVPRTSTLALTNATLPRIVALATRGSNADSVAELSGGLNVRAGQVMHPVVAAAL